MTVCRMGPAAHCRAGLCRDRAEKPPPAGPRKERNLSGMWDVGGEKVVVTYASERFGTVWYGLVRFGAVWYALVRFGNNRALVNSENALKSELKLGVGKCGQIGLLFHSI